MISSTSLSEAEIQCHPISSETRISALPEKIIDKLRALEIVQSRLGSPREKPEDFDTARTLAHDLGSLVQELGLMNHMLKMRKPLRREVA